MVAQRAERSSGAEGRCYCPAVPTASAIATHPPTSHRWSRVGVVAGSTAFFLAATGLQLLRQSGVPMWRTVWAEDGVVFYLDALDRPLRETLLDPYAGYALAVPRVIAAIGAHLPVERYSYLTALSSAAIASLFALFVYFASAPLLGSRLRQAVLAGALLFAPVLPFEVTGNLANVQWLLVMGCLLAVLLPVTSWPAIAVRVSIVVLATLTSPLCVAFVPIAVWRLVSHRRRPARRGLVVPLAYLLGAGTQLLVWAGAEQEPRVAPALGDFTVDALKLYSTRVATELVFGARVTARAWPSLGYGLAVVGVLAVGSLLVWRWLRAGRIARWFIAACAVSSVAIYVFALWQRPRFLASMSVPDEGPYNFLGSRYQLFPAALLLLALLVRSDLSTEHLVDTTVQAPVRLVDDLRANRALSVIVALWVVVAFLPSFRQTTPRSGGPDWTVEVSRAEQLCETQPVDAQVVPISPPPEWVLALPCSVLVSDGSSGP